MSPINLFHFRCLICCSSCSACPSRPRTTPSRPSGHLGRFGAQRWMDLFVGQIFCNAYFFSGPVPDHRDSPRLHLHPGPDVSWQVITNSDNKKQNFFPKYFHFRRSSRGNSVLLSWSVISFPLNTPELYQNY